MEQTADLPSNWGRWGENDEYGTLNLITDDVPTEVGLYASVRAAYFCS